MKYLLLAVGAGLIAGLGYGVERVSLTYFPEEADFHLFLGLMAAAFGVYAYAVWRMRVTFTFKELLIGAVVLRVVLMGMTPNLSDDYFRFAWDGNYLAAGENPYLVMPEEALASGEAAEMGIDGPVYEGLNSKEYYTVYPPLNQLFFGLAALVGGEHLLTNVIAMRIPILLADLGLIWLLVLLLKHFGKPISLAALYAFNPMIVLELTGNLHYEGMMLFSFVLGIWFLVRKKPWWMAALALAGGIGMKLIPLMHLPFFLRRLGWGKSILLYLGIGIVVGLCFLPFLSQELIDNFSSSLDLYFRRFEFNASIYYLLRWIGTEASGYNLIAYIGPASGGAVLLGILGLMIFEKKPDWSKLFNRMLWAMTLYLLFATIVHPWYIASLVCFAVFTRFRFPFVWSAMAMLSYAKYLSLDYVEPYALIVVEYAVVFAVIAFELIRARRTTTLKTEAA